jgi:ATP-dependent RNA helicase SUPV3L1/SUV3
MFCACSGFSDSQSNHPCDAVPLAQRYQTGHISGMTDNAQLRIVLGPTNTGKTHLAMERMLSYQSGMIGLPLRLLAREVYDRVLAGHFGKAHRADVALITGEEKIVPPNARFFICTTEAMPISREVDFVAIDEVQLAADPERGHVFTDRILHARGRHETLLLGATTMAAILKNLLDTPIESRARFSELRWNGAQKLSRLPRRSAITAFSADNVYAIAEVIRQQRGGAAVVMGGLSPRTRNAQVAMYQSGEVDFLVATDAIGMGLNMDVDHVAFAQRRKFDGRRHRDLSPAELAQIAGRAGRHKNDGSFGVTADLALFDEELVAQIENHEFEPIKSLMWRNPNLDFSTLPALIISLEHPAPRPGLARAPMADDMQALNLLSRDPAICDLAATENDVRLLWSVAQIPDFRKTMASEHSGLVGEIFTFLRHETGVIPAAWMDEQIARCDRIEGDLDTLSTRLAHIRTWTYVANRNDWLEDPQHWQERSRTVEDRLSDALHMKLMGQFVDKNSSALMRRLQGGEAVTAEIEPNGDLMVAGEYMGRLNGLRIERDPRLKGAPAGTARSAVEKTAGEALRARALAIAAAENDAFSLSDTGEIIWQTAAIARMHTGDGDSETTALAYLTPTARLLADEMLNGDTRQRAEARVTQWLRAKVADTLKPLVELQKATDLDGLARGVAFQLLENKGNLARSDIADLLARLDQTLRRQLRQYGVRFGAYNVFMPALLKPAPAAILALATILEDSREAAKDMRRLPAAGLTSVARENLPARQYRAAGFYPTRARAIRLDMLERLDDLIRPLLADAQNPKSFKMNADMMSIMGCGGDDLAEILSALGYRCIKPKPQEISTEPTSDEPAPDKLASDEPTSDEPAPDKLASDEPASETPASSQPQADNPLNWDWQPMSRAKRAARAGKKPNNKPNNKQATASRPAKSGDAKRQGLAKKRQQKPAPTIDPNSPFAALRNLDLSDPKPPTKPEERSE